MNAAPKSIVGLTGAQIAAALDAQKEPILETAAPRDMGISRVGLMELEQLRMLVGDVHSILEAYMQTGDTRLPAAAKHLIDADRSIRNGS